MKVLVVGSGGREHAIVWKIRQSPKVKEVYCAPGNAGISKIANIVNIPETDMEGLVAFAKEKEIDITIVGPEAPLVAGIVDRFNRDNLKIFGPNKKCAMLEGSKAYAKEFMIKYGIPTARYKEFTDFEKAMKSTDIFGFPVVIKADGLAAGKGVIIAKNKGEAVEALKDMMQDRKFGDAGSKVVIEEYLDGTEASVLCFVDGDTIVPMVSAQDYKKAYDGDRGPNTGGMGNYSPNILFEQDEELSKRIERDVLQNILKGLKGEGLDYKGILFIGLMIVKGEPRVLEFNVRFGDPETQVVLPRLESDLVDIIESILEGRLREIEIKWSDKKAVCVILASEGYPGSYEKGKEITGLESVEEVMVFHSGTKFQGDKVVTNGGRVLGVAALRDTIEEARKAVYENIEKINFEGKKYRKDIAKVPD